MMNNLLLFSFYFTNSTWEVLIKYLFYIEILKKKYILQYKIELGLFFLILNL